ncbi:Peptidase S10 serine carboxypeptidase protein [Dioscorea alata]|uniref:Peptidase S10 serine carboxypeptidase protein n=1 Tax=Dioscorea alata TaxID=55571 RepID=A0ACB7WN28_DIOAL|nr:Peptidase S10 serine carboxypeptidase protein [Dioscorea alata]
MSAALKLSYSMSATSLVFSLLLVPLCLWIPSPSLAHSLVSQLPGFPGSLPFHLETGYVNVDEEMDGNLFYYFVESENNPKQDPVILWLTGGPGCSSLCGLAFEIGPMGFDLPGYQEGLPTLFYNPLTWTKHCNIIFLDSPIGTGFSYSNRYDEYKLDDYKSAQDIHTFLRKWFADHPEFISNPFYFAGDSYSGMIVPVVAQKIANDNDNGVEHPFNLKGYLLGNPITDYKIDHEAKIPFVHGVGLISDELYEALKASCEGEYYTIPRNEQCDKNMELMDKCLAGINPVNVLDPVCPFASPKPVRFNADRTLLEEQTMKELHLTKSDLSKDCKTSGYLLAANWANNDTVRKALGIHEGTVKQWQRCDRSMPYTSNYPSVVEYHLDLTKRGYTALIYSGDHDMNAPHVGTQAWIKSLNLTMVDDWRPWIVDSQVAGFTRKYFNNLTYATVKGAGHTAPEYKQKECLALFQRWINDISL